MKTLNLIGWLIVTIIFAWLIFKPTIQPKPTFDQSDSIALVRIDSVKGEYQHVIDSLNKTKPKIITRVKWLKETDTIYYTGNDTACIEIIGRKNRLIIGQDSLIDLLDLEARTYSDLCLIEQNKNSLYLKRNSVLSDSIVTITALYTDSLKFERKQAKKRLFWNNVKWAVVSAAGIVGTIQTSK